MSNAGRPTKYKEEYAEIAYNLCLVLNATDSQLAEYFKVTESTINLWKLKHEKFSESLHAGKLGADMKVSKALFEKSVGATHTEERAFKIKDIEYDDNGRRISEKERIETIQVEVQDPPDTRAIQYWLNNRQGLTWSDKQKVSLEGGVNIVYAKDEDKEL